ncbi:MAG: hypothetical protein LIO57_05575 [Oscillospiraceae bacterium]|nr:hypothetical protein [Oscillospiraceae bacterium]
MKKLGFTNALALVLVVLLVFMVAGGFYLARLSIETGYTGALYCYTVIATPLGTALSVVLAKVVDKSKAENTEGGIKYEAAKAAGFKTEADRDSPAI